MKTCAYRWRHRPRPHQIDSHHIVPKSWGGLDAAPNKIDLCSQCHQNTHALIDEYVRHRGAPPTTIRRTYTTLERELAAKAWLSRPDVPTYTQHPPG